MNDKTKNALIAILLTNLIVIVIGYVMFKPVFETILTGVVIFDIVYSLGYINGLNSCKK